MPTKPVVPPSQLTPIARAHAVLSASGSPLWLVCTPSARFQENFADEDTVYAREGSFAHGLAAARLNNWLKLMVDCITDEEDEEAIFKAAHEADWAEFHNKELDDYVQGYVDRCLAMIDAARKRDPLCIVLVEQRMPYTHWVPEGFGTGDLVIVSTWFCWVRDLKFGKGVRVDAVDNSQLMIYGLAAYQNYYSVIHGFDQIVVEIDQPRLDHIDRMEMSVEDLLKWGEEVVRPRAALAWDGAGPFVPGSHCTESFCRARFQCKARAEHAMAVIDEQERFAKLTVTDGQLNEMLPRLKAAIKWAQGLLEQAELDMKEGRKEYPSMKLVEGRRDRYIDDPDAVKTAMIGLGFKEEELYDRELKAMTKLEKMAGKKHFAEFEKQGWIRKPDKGPPTMVPATDPRPAIRLTNSAEDDFEDET